MAFLSNELQRKSQHAATVIVWGRSFPVVPELENGDLLKAALEEDRVL